MWSRTFISEYAPEEEEEVNDAAKISHETINFFDIVQEFYVFFSASTKRWEIFIKQNPELKLKPLSDTRWSSRIDAICVKYLMLL